MRRSMSAVTSPLRAGWTTVAGGLSPRFWTRVCGSTHAAAAAPASAHVRPLRCGPGLGTLGASGSPWRRRWAIRAASTERRRPLPVRPRVGPSSSFSAPRTLVQASPGPGTAARGPQAPGGLTYLGLAGEVARSLLAAPYFLGSDSTVAGRGDWRGGMRERQPRKGGAKERADAGFEPVGSGPAGPFTAAAASGLTQAVYFRASPTTPPRAQGQSTRRRRRACGLSWARPVARMAAPSAPADGAVRVLVKSGAAG